MRSPGAEWRFELPASLEAIDEVCLKFQEWRALHCGAVEAFASELLLREALTNSVVHGASEDPRQRVSCVLRAGRGRLLIAVRDSGNGFDWRATFRRRADSSETHGRGIEILKHYASSVRFNFKGNSVTLVKQF